MKKEYTLRTITESGDVVGEDTIFLEEGSTLIQVVPSNLSNAVVERMHKHLSNALLNESVLITIPYCVKLQVLEVK